MNTAKSLNFAELNTLLVNRGVEEVCSYLNISFKKSGTNLKTGSISGESGQSMSISLHGEYQGHWTDFATNEHGDLVELWVKKRGITKSQAYYEICDYLNVNNKNQKNKTIDIKANRNTINELNRRLMVNKEALSYLYDRGLSAETINNFGLGLTKPYKNKEGLLTGDALRYPLVNEQGHKTRWALFYNIPGVTKNPLDKKAWTQKGRTATLYYNTAKNKHRIAFVCEGPKDLWIVHQKICGTQLEKEMVLITSTHGSVVPKDIGDNDILRGFSKVYLGHDNDESGEKMAMQVFNAAGVPCYRMKVPSDVGKDWTDFFKVLSVGDFQELLKKATPILNKIKDYRKTNEALGEFEYNPIDVNCSYADGHLYYAVKTLSIVEEKKHKPSGEFAEVKAEGLTVKIIRDDKKILKIKEMPRITADPTASKRPIYRLTDGTLIEELPKPNPYSNWEWTSVKKWLSEKKGINKIDDILQDILAHLGHIISLPFEDDYAILSLTAVVTYAQQIFDSVPLLLATGSAGTGKSALGRAMADICANAVMCGAVTAATIARTVNQARGFIVIDDLEKIATRRGGDPQFHELIQALKVSYNKATAIKIWTDVKTMEPAKLNFYGVKLVGLTRDVDEILGSRMLKIYTKEDKNFSPKQIHDPVKLAKIRNNLHCWVFDNMDVIATAYKRYSKSTRIKEITAPLRSIADLTDQPSKYHLTIDRFIERMENDKIGESIEDIFETAVFNILSRGYQSYSREQIILEIKTLVPKSYGRDFTNEIAEYDNTNWIRRQLKQKCWLPDEGPVRKRPCGTGSGRQEQFYSVTPTLLTDFKTTQSEKKIQQECHGWQYCQRYINCRDCVYASVECPHRVKFIDHLKK